MAFHNVELPTSIQYASVAGLGFGTLIRDTASGHEYRTAIQGRGRHRFSLRIELLNPDDAKALKSFAMGRRGSLHSFKLKDFSDFTTAADGESAPSDADGEIGTGDGTTTGPFQLTKTYLPGDPGEYVRTITMPVTGTVVIALDGTPLPETDYTVSSTGQIEFDVAPGNGVVITAGCEFRVAARFERSFDEWMQLRADAYQVWSAANVDCVEVLDEVEFPEIKRMGGAKDHGTITTSIRIELIDGTLHTWECDTASVSLYLPIPTWLPAGSDVFTLISKAGSSQNVTVRDDAGNSIVAFGSGGGLRRIHLFRDPSTLATTWVATQ